MTDSEYDTLAETTNDKLWREAFIDAGAETLADIRQDWNCQKQLIEAKNRELQVNFDALLAPLRERIARLEGQITVLLGGDSTNSPTRSKRSKQSPVNDHGRLLEHRRSQ
jgi:hypothetical protein